MQHQNTLLHGLLKMIGRARFERWVEAQCGDWRVRALDCWSQFVAMVFGQLCGTQSLRELEGALNSHSNLLYHVGVGRVRRSTLADANATRPVAVFEAAFGFLLAQLQGRMGARERREMLRLVDASVLPLSGGVSQWARFCANHVAAKLHLVYDPTAQLPTYFAVSAAKVTDITAAKHMPIELGASYVFDKGYYDFGWWAALDAAGCRFVTRRKTNSPVRLVKARQPRGANIKSDKIVRLSARLKASRKNPYAKPLRQIELVTPQGQLLILLTNDLKSSARHIAELYKTRWEIEIFFKWIKQNLKIRKFLGTTPNAVRLQIVTALIAYLLIRLAQITSKTTLTLQALIRLVRVNLMQRKSFLDLIKAPPDILPPTGHQLTLAFAHA